MDLLTGRKFSILLKVDKTPAVRTFLGVASMNLKELCFIRIYFFLTIVASIMKSAKVQTCGVILLKYCIIWIENTCMNNHVHRAVPHYKKEK